ncbi:dynamin family protein [Anaerobacillus sp. MEB173]|uniref:dynamin family protein n=1 Tax=Anaerobacillus sp. MEB173 TaxID=3383345 RepID=UPI003F914B32
MSIAQQTKLDIESVVQLNEEEQHRIKLLKEKRKQETFEVAFCGHFSAGKSTILNTLLGAEVLPTSPIPTSANIISIKNGPLALSVTSHDGSEKIWKGEIPWHQVREWGMDGHEISTMTITAPLAFLGEHSAILDTPGVDSTDDSHQAVTVEQLYTTDFIVYVMDYNHVQSETNLYFLKQLSKEKKPLFIIINQIDKHNEAELSVTAFNQSIEEVFRRWEINYLELFYTSMKKKDHHLNEFKQFEKKIKGLLYHSKQLIDHSNHRLYEGVYQAVESRLHQEMLENVDEVVAEMEEQGYEGSQLNEREQLQQQLTTIINEPNRIEHAYGKELDHLFKNVTLFPYTTTELTREWLESIQPGFKVGLFFTKKKTEEEQSQRLNKLVTELNDKIKSQLLFHLQALFQQSDRTRLSNREKFETAVDALHYEVDGQFIQSRVKIGNASRDYVYTFTKELTAVIVSELKRKCQDVIAIEKEGVIPYLQSEKNNIEMKLAQLEKVHSFVEKVEQVKGEYEAVSQNVKTLLQELDDHQTFENEIRATFSLSYQEQEDNCFGSVTLPEDNVIETNWTGEHEAKKDKDSAFSEEETKKWLGKLEESLHPFRNKKILQHERNQLIERIERYNKQTFVISLFGAFSAGKSSFANALIGEFILPVSPNPTTATVNTVRRSDEEHEHGTAVVFVKSKEQLEKEVATVGKQLDVELTLDTLLTWKPKNNQIISTWQKTYADYLLTIKGSLKETTWELGGQFTVTIEDLKELIAEEDKACLLEEVTIYYDCPITKKGIILVDTPGVNSIHGRHTNVAFRQLRRSDAIFYLTYYNHAFSKADQYFLQQMGKVNESFSHDKLYFVINAADLAGSERELNGVRKHVYDQLLRNGITSPRLHHVSSKQGLEAKQGKSDDTSFAAFETVFYRDTISELKQLSSDLIKEDFNQFVQKIDDSLSFMTEAKEKQQERFEQLKQLVTEKKETVKDLSFQHVLRDIKGEQAQLLLYLKDRLSFVLNDYYPSAINSSVITGTSKKAGQDQLLAAIKEWRTLGEYFLKQEIEATMIRIEEKVKVRIKDWLLEEVKVLQQGLPHLYCEAEFDLASLNLPEETQLIPVEGSEFVSVFKSKKDFFENGVIRELKEKLVAKGSELGSHTLQHVADHLNHELMALIHRAEDELKGRLAQALDEEVNRFAALFDESEQDALITEKKTYQELVV